MLSSISQDGRYSERSQVLLTSWGEAILVEDDTARNSKIGELEKQAKITHKRELAGSDDIKLIRTCTHELISHPYSPEQPSHGS